MVTGKNAAPTISVLMPTYEQSAFIARAIQSLQAQTFDNWELVIVDDGSPDNTSAIVQPYLKDPRIQLHRLPENVGLGAALNVAMSKARAYFAYLPSDDVYYSDHLASLYHLLLENPQAILAFSGVRHHYNRTTEGKLPNDPLQLVQVLHRRSQQRWLERRELVTDDLGRMYWDKLKNEGEFVNTGLISCEWVNHPKQLHKFIREPEGGLNAYRARFQVKHPLHFHSSIGNCIDEEARYIRFQNKIPAEPQAHSLKILLVGELAYNAERILAFEERGHQLYGLWMRDPHWYNTVGPLPFGHVQDIPYHNWREEVRRIQPDVIYALLNWQAVPFAHEIMTYNPGIPFIWHFKEGPFICLERGTWPQLVDLYRQSDGQIYVSPEMRDWFAALLPGGIDPQRTLILDGDLPKREWFSEDRSPRLSERDSDIHTVVPGRPIGLHPRIVAQLAAERIHVHFYGDYTQGQWRDWIDQVMRIAPNYLHLHPNADQGDWVREFS
jgi:glycosyltransferase involved in cell wall biosynthesis